MSRGFSLNNANKKYVVIGLFFVLVVIAGKAIANNLSGPSVGTVAPESQSSEKPDASKTKVIQGKYVSFKYPGSLVQKPIKPSGVILENFSLASQNIPFWNVTLTILPLPSGNLADNSAYNLRLQNANQYSLGTIMAGDKSFPIFTSQLGGYEKMAFVVGSKMVATVSLTSSAGLQEQQFDAALKRILADFEWRTP